MRIFLASILNFVLFHCLLCINNKIFGERFFDWSIMRGATIIPRSLQTTLSEKNFQDRPNFFFFFQIIYDPLIFADYRFSKIRSINSDRDGFMCQSWAKMSKFIPLSLRLSEIEFSLV
jgi:hypothetical protein